MNICIIYTLLLEDRVLKHQPTPDSTPDRVARLGLTNDGQMDTCLLCNIEPEDLLHCFFGCTKSLVSGLTLLGWVQNLVPDLSPESAITLDLQQELSEHEELATVCTLAVGLKYIWEARVGKKLVATFEMRAKVEATISILQPA